MYVMLQISLYTLFLLHPFDKLYLYFYLIPHVNPEHILLDLYLYTLWGGAIVNGIVFKF